MIPAFMQHLAVPALLWLLCFEAPVVVDGFRGTAYVSRMGHHMKWRVPALEMAALNQEPLELCQENAELVIDEVRQELGTIFGYDAKSKEVGITGEIDLVEVDGPAIIVALRGRFWHATDTVMLRVESFIKQRIPEVIEVSLDMQSSAIVDDNRLNTEGSGEKRLF